MLEPFFSIVIPFYNRAATLSRAIRSVQAQTFSNWELILVDDASTDGSLSIAALAAQADQRIRVFANTVNQERCRSRNRGIKEAKGKYVCFLDSDDYHLPEHLSFLFNRLHNLGYPEAFLFTKAWNEDAQGNTEERFCPDFNGIDPYRYFILYTVNPQRWCVHARIFKEVQFDPEIPICEDMDTALRILNRGTPIYEMKERTTVYVAYPDSFTWGDPKKWQRELDALHSIFARKEFQSKLPMDACRLRKSACYYHLAIESWKQKKPVDFYKRAFLSFILCPKGYNGKTNKQLLVMALYVFPGIGPVLQKTVKLAKAAHA